MDTYSKDLSDFVALSRYAGERFDLIQAGGGNASVKTRRQTMVIKASGFAMSEVTVSSGHSSVDLTILAEHLDKAGAYQTDKNNPVLDTLAESALERAVLEDGPKPSIETFMHSLLDKFALHTHPLAVNIACCRPDGRRLVENNFPEAVFVEYSSVGLPLALALQKAMPHSKTKQPAAPAIVFLQNHGMIVSGADASQVIKTTEETVIKTEALLGLDFSEYRSVSSVSQYINSIVKENYICLLCRDRYIEETLRADRGLLKAGPFCPDDAVYNGSTVLEIENTADHAPLKRFIETHGAPPRVVAHGNSLFFVARSVRAAAEMERVFKARLIVAKNAGENMLILQEDEVSRLNNLKAEQRRRQM